MCNRGAHIESRLSHKLFLGNVVNGGMEWSVINLRNVDGGADSTHLRANMICTVW